MYGNAWLRLIAPAAAWMHMAEDGKSRGIGAWKVLVIMFRLTRAYQGERRCLTAKDDAAPPAIFVFYNGEDAAVVSGCGLSNFIGGRGVRC